MKVNHTRADVARALRDLERIYKPTPRDRAEAAMTVAKRLMDQAAAAVLASDPDASAVTDRALAALHSAQAELARVNESELNDERK